MDFLSVNKETGEYFVDVSTEDSKENIITGEYEKKVVEFLMKLLHID